MRRIRNRQDEEEEEEQKQQSGKRTLLLPDPPSRAAACCMDYDLSLGGGILFVTEVFRQPEDANESFRRAP